VPGTLEVVPWTNEVAPGLFDVTTSTVCGISSPVDGIGYLPGAFWGAVGLT
jgi:hypothetical protein